MGQNKYIKKIIFSFITFNLLILNFSLALAQPPQEFEPLSQKPSDIDYVTGLKYEESAQYAADLDKACNLAVKFCNEYRQSHPEARNLAIVSDLDETLLDNRPFYDNCPKFNHKAFHEWITGHTAKTLGPTEIFLKQARLNGYAIFFITGRRERDRVATTYNLVKDNVDYDGLFLKPNDFKGKAYEYKTNVRKSIEDMGFTIVENIGDQVSDLCGGYSLDCTKLPNKIYFVP